MSQRTKNRTKESRKCPRCGTGKTSNRGGNRFCGQCGWNDKPATEQPVMEQTPVKEIIKDSMIIH
jgi:hypothetical protein